MRPDFQQFGENIYALIGALILAGLVFFVLLGGWTTLRVARWRRIQRRAEQTYRKSRFDANGTPLPPMTRGICQHCGKSRGYVYHLPTGERLCPAHYAAREQPEQDASSVTAKGYPR